MKRIAAAALAALIAVACATNQTTRVETAPSADALHGVASWYGQEFAGRTTANGEIFDPMLMTAAHRTLPFNTVVDVKNPKTGQTVRVRINDRGPFVNNRLIDLSYAAAQQIGLIEPGSGDVDLAIVRVGNDREPPAPYVVEIKQPKEKIAIPAGAAEPPKIDFPLPAESASSAPANVPVTPAVVDQIAVVEEHHGVDTRRQVGADGRTIENVPVEPGSVADHAGAPGHETASDLDRARHPDVVVTETPRTRPTPAPSSSSSTGRTARSVSFNVQVGAFSIEANAKALQQRLTAIGQQSYIDRANLWRVRIGPFATREQAIKARERLEAAGMSAIIVTD
jgi:rare lipoprotein A